MNINRRWVILGIVVVAIAAYFVFDLGQYFSLGYFKSQHAALDSAYAAHPLKMVAAFFFVYVISVALSFPGATVLTLAAGAIFGVLWGTVIVSFASTLGATLAFLGSRYLLRDGILSRYGDKLKPINEGVAKDGAFYLFTLRLVPAFPFFLINLVMGLTPIKTWTFFWVSQLGMLAGTAVYVNAGTQLAQLTSLKGVVSPGLLGAFVLLGIFPYIARGAINWFRDRRIYLNYTKPKTFDRNLIVIGAGSGGPGLNKILGTIHICPTMAEMNKYAAGNWKKAHKPAGILRIAERFHNWRRN